MTDSTPVASAARITVHPFGYGEVKYLPAVAPRPETVTRHGTVEFRNAAVPGQAACFVVTFTVDLAHILGQTEFPSQIVLPVFLPDLPADAPYLTVETEAARSLAPLLRSIADQVQAMVKAAEAGLAEGADSPAP